MPDATERWLEAQFRDDVVLARVDAGGAFAADKNGLVDFRYKPSGKVYRTRADRLAAKDGAVPKALPPAPAATPKASAAPRGKKRGGLGLSARRADAIQVWTDGACSGNPGPSGAGVLYEDGDTVHELSEYLGIGTNNIAELTAILRGIELVTDPSRPVDIMTDSSYCIGLLTQGWKAKKNQELVATLREAYSRLSDVQLIKVKGHAGIAGNEKADELATTAVERRASTSTNT